MVASAAYGVYKKKLNSEQLMKNPTIQWSEPLALYYTPLVTISRRENIV
jgi:hypothetical protein